MTISCHLGTVLQPTVYLVIGTFFLMRMIREGFPKGTFSHSNLPLRMVFKKSAQLFKGVRFMLVSKNQRHSESWTPVLNAANAIVVDDLPSSPGTATRELIISRN